jgi:hypothetical protein
MRNLLRLPGILWPLLGALIVPTVAALGVLLTSPATFAYTSEFDWLMLPALGFLAGVGYFLKYRLFDPHTPSTKPYPSELNARLDAMDPAALTEAQAIDRTPWIAMRQAAERHAAGAHTYRKALEAQLNIMNQLLDPEHHPPPLLSRLFRHLFAPDRYPLTAAMRDEMMRDRDGLTAELSWAKEREGPLGHLFG